MTAQVYEFSTTIRERNRFGVSLPLIFAIGIYSLLITHGSAVLRDPDTFWHISVGRWIIEHRSLPGHGIFSATMANAPWLDQEWLAEVLMAWGYDHFGWAALAIVTALCEAVTIAILLRALLGALSPVHAMFAATLTGALWFPHILARPFILTIPILAVWVVLLVRARSENRVPSLWLTLLIVPWANMHGSVMFGLGIAALLAAEAVLLAPDWRGRVHAAFDWGRFGAVALGAVLITPFGFEGLFIPFHIANMSMLSNISEWHAVDFSKIGALPLLMWLLIVLFAALTLGWRLPPTRVGMLLFLLALTFKHVRYSEYLGLVGSLLLAPSLASQIDRLSENATKGLDRLMAELARPASWRGVAICAAIVLTLSMIVLPGRNPQPVDTISPVAALAEVKANHIEGPVFNSYEFGGYLIFSGIEPFIDGRAELYGDDLLKRYGDAVLLTDDPLPQLLSDYGITWTMLSPKAPAVALMDHLPGWRRLYGDSIAVVHVRQVEGS